MKVFKLLGIIVLAAIIVSFTGCATTSSIGGTHDPHGLISSARVVTEGATEIGSYMVILGLIDVGYADYAAKVKEAEAEGKQITSVTTWYYFLTRTAAYAK